MMKWIIGVVAVLLVGAGAWWYFSKQPAPAPQPAAQQPQGPDTSDQSLQSDHANIVALVATFDAIMGDKAATSTITAQAQNALSVADAVGVLSDKLAIRLGTASSTEFADLSAQLTDIRLQGNAAMSHLSAGTPSEIRKAKADMVVARQDMTKALKDLAAVFASVGVVASSTPATSMQ